MEKLAHINFIYSVQVGACSLCGSKNCVFALHSGIIHLFLVRLTLSTYSSYLLNSINLICLSQLQALPFWYVAITGLCVIENFGWYIFMIFFMQPAIFCLLLLDIRSRLLIWLLCYGCCYFFTEYSGIAVSKVLI